MCKFTKSINKCKYYFRNLFSSYFIILLHVSLNIRSVQQGINPAFMQDLFFSQLELVLFSLAQQYCKVMELGRIEIVWQIHTVLVSNGREKLKHNLLPSPRKDNGRVGEKWSAQEELLNKFYILNKMKRRRLRWFIFCQLSTKITLEKERWIAKMGLIISNIS